MLLVLDQSINWLIEHIDYVSIHHRIQVSSLVGSNAMMKQKQNTANYIYTDLGRNLAKMEIRGCIVTSDKRNQKQVGLAVVNNVRKQVRIIITAL